ncbi:uncharacterized protein LOC109713478 [Ananas comosus]|uniref:Uncharacterized protein LOC109713478 n=1 Tax=Ananas comosus TaxID=4615 RepID=A0A6P5FI84_ANACO|nr:uncharacterized protein LOC109713478 [Ananas comosus]
MGHKGEGVTVGCKVLPICDAVSATGPNGADSGGEGSSEKEAGRSGERRRALSRMKELIKWAAAAKSHKVGSKAWKILYFKSRASLKDPLDDHMSSNSSKISFRWDVGSCSSTSTVYSPLSAFASTARTTHMIVKSCSNLSVALQSTECDDLRNSCSLNTEGGCVRTGQWITTDSDFVVLEL